MNLTYEHIINNKQNKGTSISLYFHLKNEKEFINSFNKQGFTPINYLHKILL